MKRSRAGFTLVELLVVIAIVALLISILLPALSKARKEANVIQCASNLRQFALGLNMYAAQNHRNTYPTHSTKSWAGQITVWSTQAPAYVAAFPDKDSYMEMFTKIVCGGNRKILFCPLDRWFNPTAGWSFIGTDPAYPEFWYDSRFGENYMGGYFRFAGMEENWGAWQWTHSGNRRTDQAPLKPGGWRDAILCDKVWSSVGGEYQEMHMEGYQKIGPAAVRGRSSNNVAYGDGPVETHRQRPSIGPDGFLTWGDAHYVDYGSSRAIY